MSSASKKAKTASGKKSEIPNNHANELLEKTKRSSVLISNGN